MEQMKEANIIMEEVAGKYNANQKVFGTATLQITDRNVYNKYMMIVKVFKGEMLDKLMMHNKNVQEFTGINLYYKSNF